MPKKSKMLKKIREHILTAWLIIAAVSMIGIVSFAAYTSSHTAKSVVSTRGGSVIPFSSNHLSQLVGTVSNKKSISVNENSTDPAINVTICNYPQDNPAKYYSEDISYDLIVTLVNKEGNPYDVDGKSNLLGNEYTTRLATDPSMTEEWYKSLKLYYNGSDEALSFVPYENELKIEFSDYTNKSSYKGPSRILKGYQKSVDNWSLHYPASQIYDNDVFIRIDAIPHTTKDNITHLSSYLGITPREGAGSTGWSGGFIDSESHAPHLYDAFNYVVSGNGTANIVLSWDERFVTLSPWSRQLISGAEEGTSGNYTTLSFSVDSTSVSSYSLQFYRKRTPSQDEEWQNDDDMNLLLVRKNVPVLDSDNNQVIEDGQPVFEDVIVVTFKET